MSEEETAHANGNDEAVHWYDNKNLVIAWILTFFPVGIYGLWKNQEFIRNVKFGVTVAVAMAFVLGINFTHPLYVFVAFPAGIYLLWKNRKELGGLWKRFALVYPIILVLALLQAANTPVGGAGSILGGSCSAVITEGNCTYFRDDDCNVISKSCN
ncbi:hypothetical protein [Maritalea porphyrae]|uniref:Uncharacterized protein n=1 Tax=Maritalea porphyrae TaxID=880732 RepID=A0ABQ5UWI0_9HYPH|nr:hypothetical protein [Maritalea porphyrae]GLQ19037.1 hypothetical protein GCM10007879_32860 [Maritalea porphyrae]